MKYAQHPRTGSAIRVKEKLWVLWDVMGTCKDWSKRNGVWSVLGGDIQLGTGRFGLNWEPCREEGKDVAVTGVIALKANEICCLQQERCRGACVLDEMLGSPGWVCCAKASSSTWDEQELSWSKCTDWEGPGLPKTSDFLHKE